jgi:hypothetical protein
MLRVLDSELPGSLAILYQPIGMALQEHVSGLFRGVRLEFLYPRAKHRTVVRRGIVHFADTPSRSFLGAAAGSPESEIGSHSSANASG